MKPDHMRSPPRAERTTSLLDSGSWDLQANISARASHVSLEVEQPTTSERTEARMVAWRRLMMR